METWQVAALVAMVFLAAYAIAVKQFFNLKYDWRAFIPLSFVVVAVLMAYFFYSGAQNEAKTDSYLFAALLGLIFCISTIASFVAMKEGPIGVVVPIFSLNLVFVAIGGVILFRENMSIYKLAGILLGITSIFLLTVEAK